jgi:hypothetical protein
MLAAILRSKKLRAIGSVVDVCPLGDYSEHVPTERPSVAIAAYWKEAGKYLGTAIEQHDKAAKHSRNEPA